MKRLVLLIALGAAYYFAQAKTFLKEYKIKFLKAKLDRGKTRDASYSRIYFTLKMLIENKTAFTGTLQSGYITVSYKKKIVGSALVKQPITVAKQEDTLINIPAEIETLKMLSSLPDMFNLLQSSNKITFHLDGELRFAIGTYRINQEYDVIL